MIMENKNTYNLCSKERRYKEETLISYYFKSNKKIEKKFMPVDIDGERFRLDKETGEIKTYKKSQIISSHKASLRRTIILMNMLLSMNDFEWFWTLTFDKARIDRTNEKEVFKCYKKYINNLKKKFPNFKYMSFPERHEDNCFHFHLLVGGITSKQMGLVNSGKVCCHWSNKKFVSPNYFNRTKKHYELKETDGEPVYNVTTFAYGFTTVSKIVSRERCNSYVKKYVEKALGSTEVFKKRFYYSSNLNTPSIVNRIIGADFDKPYELDKMSFLQNNHLNMD